MRLECFVCGGEIVYPDRWQACGYHRQEKIHVHSGECMKHYQAEHERLMDELDRQFGHRRASRETA